jgi:dipeptidyl aminopeptidase/acylaminoacyl peptidase
MVELPTHTRCMAFVIHCPRPPALLCAWLVLLAPAIGAAAAPVEAFATRSGIATARLSPDGQRIVYVAERAGGHEARVVDLDTGAEQTVLEDREGRARLRWCDWSGVQRVVCGTHWVDEIRGTFHEQTGLMAVDADGGGRRRLMRDSQDPVRDRIVDFVVTEDRFVLVEHDEDGDGLPQVSQLDTRSGALRPIVRPLDPVRRWLSNGRGLVRLGVGYEQGVGSIYVRAAEGDEWNLIARHRLDDPGAWAPLAFGEDAADLYALKLHDGRYALFHVDLNRGGALSLMFAHPEFDVAGPVLLAPRSRDLLAVRYVTDRVREHFFDAREQALQRALDAALPDRVNLIVDRDRSGARALVWSYSDAWPGSMHVLELPSGHVTEIGRQYPDLDAAGLGRTIALAYHARDGQLVPAYLTVPRDRVPQGLPAILLPHGGPENRVEWGFDPLVQLLATRGFAVLQMNFRGSSGFGVGYLAAGAGEWDGVMHRDVTDGAHWLVRQGIADPDRLCIAGSSFGGYLALLAAVREPQTYRCVASLNGVADLNALLESKQRFRFSETWRARLGNDPQKLARASPVTRASEARAAILLVHGSDDVVVPPGQSRAMASALERASRAVDLEILAGCGHDLESRACRIGYYRRLEAFLSRYALAGSSD